MADSRYRTLAVLIAVIIGAAIVGAYLALQREEPDPPVSLVPDPIPTEQLTVRPRFGLLGAEPEWESLDRFQGLVSRDRFESELIGVYSEGNAWKSVIALADEHAKIKTTDGTLQLEFAEDADGTGVDPPRFWRKGGELPPAADPKSRPLEGLRVAIDAGHLGGEWAKMEERWYQIGNGIEVKEGELTLLTAKQLAFALRKGGAEVHLVRSELEPVTGHRPADFRELAAEYLQSRGMIDRDKPDASSLEMIEREAEKLFYRAAEIRQRAWVVNERIQPDLVVCLHFNAESWGNPNKPEFVPRNHMHFLVNGTYSTAEMRLHDQRYEMVLRLLEGIHGEELAVTSSVADALAVETGLPPYVYRTSNAKLVGRSPYVYARNLLANRLYRCPVIFCEPFVMNNREVYDRIAAGDYDGTREFGGKKRLSIYKEYALGIYRGLAKYYREERKSN